MNVGQRFGPLGGAVGRCREIPWHGKERHGREGAEDMDWRQRPEGAESAYGQRSSPKIPGRFSIRGYAEAARNSVPALLILAISLPSPAAAQTSRLSLGAMVQHGELAGLSLF